MPSLRDWGMGIVIFNVIEMSSLRDFAFAKKECDSPGPCEPWNKESTLVFSSEGAISL